MVTPFSGGAGIDDDPASGGQELVCSNIDRSILPANGHTALHRSARAIDAANFCFNMIFRLRKV